MIHLNQNGENITMCNINKCPKLTQAVNTQYNEELLIKDMEPKYI